MENLSLNHESTDQETKFTPDIITEILLRLPVKPLARFKCVSQTWLSLIRSLPFIHRHITHSLSGGGLHLTRFIRSTLSIVDLPALDSSPVKTIQLPFSAQSGTADLAGSCHGLILISDHPFFAAVYNPSNFTFHVIPFNDKPRRWHESYWVDLGLGFDFFSQDYKLVRVDQNNGPGPAYPARRAQIFSLKLNKWKKLKADFPHFLATPKGHGKFSNNCLHWMATINPPGSYDLNSLMTHPGQADPTVYKYLIVALNLFTETFLEIPTPDFYAGGHEFPVPTLVAVEKEDGNNTLMVSVEFGPMECRSVDVWVMKKYGVKDSWTKILTFHHGLTRPEAIGRAKAIMVSKDECEVLMEESDRPAKYFWVHCESGRVREVEIQGQFSGIFSWCGGHPCDFGSVAYVESMVRLKNVGLEHSPEPDYGNKDEEEVSERLSGKGRIYIDPIKDERMKKEHDKMRRKLTRMPTVMYLKEPLRRN